MSGLSHDVMKRIISVISQYPQIDEVVLYGSRAKGNYHPGSDIDLTFKGDQLNLQVLNQVSNQLDDLLLPYLFDLSIFQQIENLDLLERIERVGQVIYPAKE
jgi:predicted nucleotidyltransferase